MFIRSTVLTFFPSVGSYLWLKKFFLWYSATCVAYIDLNGQQEHFELITYYNLFEMCWFFMGCYIYNNIWSSVFPREATLYFLFLKFSRTPREVSLLQALFYFALMC